MSTASIIVEMDSNKYKMYFRTIRQRAQAPNRKCSQGQALFCGWILGGARCGGG